jgi:hypothetical protein
MRDARDPARGRWFHVPKLVWRFTRLTTSSRDLLTPYAAIVPLLSVPFLSLVAFAAAAVFIEALIAVVVLLVLLIT